MPNPIIAITAGKRSIAATASERGEEVFSSPVAYSRAVERSGGAPLLLPRSADASVLDAAMERVDGLLLSGGGDILPSEYSERTLGPIRGQDDVRDRMEFAAARIARKRGIPILGICRGVQALNVAFGGSLIQDIPSQVKDALAHDARPDETPASHGVRISPDSLLARVLGAGEATVNSSHHQSTNQPGAGLRTVARTEDGVVEGLEADDGSPVLGVQWHPERTYDDSPLSRKLFDWLVAEATKRLEKCGERFTQPL